MRGRAGAEIDVRIEQIRPLLTGRDGGTLTIPGLRIGDRFSCLRVPEMWIRDEQASAPGGGPTMSDRRRFGFGLFALQGNSATLPRRDAPSSP